MFLPMLARSVSSVWRCHWLAIAVVLAMSTASVAQLSESVVWVEEDWELVLVEPDGDLLAPQFHTVMSPLNDLDTYYAQITWNYWEAPEFTPGGFQVQGWHAGEVEQIKSIGSEKFNVNAETVRWTQVMTVLEGEIWFVILYGQSQTWGDFGGIGTIVSGLTDVPNLDGYSPDLSVENSWVTYGANRVSSLRIVEVRYYSETNLLYTDTTPRVVYACE